MPRERDSNTEADTVTGVSYPVSKAHGISPAEIIHGDTIVVRQGPAEVTPGTTPPHAVAPSAVVANEIGPTRFAVSIGSHPPIPLDVPAFVGRRPKTSRITGAVLPRLVMVPSPSKQVSATHVEIRQEGDNVVVTDLGSTNGTIVRNPGKEPFGLRQGESVVIVEGSIVDIGDGISFTIVAERTDATGVGAE